MTIEPDTIAPETRIGEVVASSTSEFTVHCYRLYDTPPLGSLVRAGSDAITYGIIGEISTNSLDPGRRTIAVGERAKSEQEVYKDNPQLNRLLSTELRCMVAGHKTEGQLRHHLAPLPPRIHAFVYTCCYDELREFSKSLDFLQLLVSAPFGSTDDVVSYFLRLASQAQPEAEAENFLLDGGKQLAKLLSGDSQRLSAILRRLSP